MPTGLTKDAGWQIGVSRTLPYPPEDVWALLTSPEGAEIWAGPEAVIVPEPGTRWSASDGSRGEIRSHDPGRKLRLTFRPAGWSHETTVQIVVVQATGQRASVRFHQERLADAAERARQREHWRAVLDRLEDALSART